MPSVAMNAVPYISLPRVVIPPSSNRFFYSAIRC